MKRAAGLAWMALLLALGACSEKPQGMMSPNSDMQAYEGAQDPFVVPGWKVGDKSSWQAQLRTRAQGQNEYVRMGGH